MRKLLFALIAVGCIACFKENKDKARFITYEAKEFRSGLPLRSALIELFYCSMPDLVFGCRQISVLATLFTDDSGKARIDQSTYHRASGAGKISKAGYFTRNVLAGEVTFLDPEIPVTRKLVVKKSLPPEAHLQITVLGAQRLSYEALLLTPVPVKDSLVSIKAIAGQVNLFSWRVFVPGFGPVENLAEGVIKDVAISASGPNEITLVIQ